MTENSIHNENLAVTPEEWPRIFGGVLTEWDFSTSAPNPGRIDKICAGIDAYLKYKQQHLQ